MLGAIIQARMESERLPGKSMMDICGKPMLAHVVERVREVVPNVCIATTPLSREIIDYAVKEGIRYFLDQRPRDVLDTFYRAASAMQFDPIVRITGDNPLIELKVIRLVIDLQMETSADWAANCRLKTTFPIGDDCEVFTFKALGKTWREAEEAYDRQHVTPYMYRNPRLFSYAVEQAYPDRSHERWTVDTWDDLERVRKLTEAQLCLIQG